MKIILEEGKYTYHFESGKQWVDRYDKPWKSPKECAGDNVLLAMAHRIEELEEAMQLVRNSY